MGSGRGTQEVSVVALIFYFYAYFFFGNKYSKLLRSAGAGWLGNLTYSYSIYSLYSSACFNII